jgi:hypothetical protein
MGLAYRHGATAAALSLVLCTGVLRVMAETLASGEEASATVAVHNVQVGPGGRVSGVLENASPRLLRDVRLLVRHTWLWSKERAPQRDNPGRAVYYVVPDDIPPDGSVSFTYQPDPPLPTRPDGHFETSVEVVGFTEVGE